MKKIVMCAILSLGFSSNLFANDVCNQQKIDEMFANAVSQGAKILKTEPSSDLEGFCEVYMNMKGRVDIIYANLKKSEFLSGAVLVGFNKEKGYFPKNLDKLTSINQELDNEKSLATKKMLLDDKKLEEVFSYTMTEYSKKDSKKYINKSYDILVFESLLCPYCKELNSMLENTYKEQNIKLNKYYVPLNEADYNNLKDNYYKDEEKLKKALELKSDLGIEGVPMIIIRDAKTKKFVELIKAPTSPTSFENLKSFIK